ncbi:MAG: tetratricopeptide repeat protein [Polyangiales bacterium]
MNISDDVIAAIDGSYARLGGTYFEILNVPRSCDAETLRRAYRTVCERFHPDLYTDEELGPRRALVEAIFREATHAFQTLCRPDLRAEYERELPPDVPPEPYHAPRASALPPGAPAAQSVLAFGLSDEGASRPVSPMRFPTPAFGANAPDPPPPPSPPPSPPPAVPPPARAPSMLKRTPIAALLVGPSASPPSGVPLPPHAATRPTSSSAGSNPQIPASEPSATRPAPRSTHTPTNQRPTARPVDSTTISSLQRGRAEMLLRNKRQLREEFEGQLAATLARGDLDAATQLVRHALTLEPDDEALQRRLQQLESASKSSDLDRIAQLARSHERAGRWEPAAELWAKAAAQQPGEYSYHLYAAQAFCESGNELAKAADLARRATRLRPEAVEAHVCLARTFFRAGRVASAKSALEQALKLAPQSPAVLELARQLRV